MKFTGIVESRTFGKATSGPPGETEIFRLNPGRRELILSQTGWLQVEPGTLNLIVRDQVLDELTALCAVIEEPGSDVRYPSPYEYIPLHRKCYFYYSASVSVNSKVQDVLVRRAEIRIRRRVELFAPVNLRRELDLSDGDRIEVEVRESEP